MSKPEHTAVEPDQAIYVPGTWRCAKCGFVLVQSNLNARDGTVTPRDEPGTRCPNDDSPMWRVTWKDESREAMTEWEKQVERAKAAETLLGEIVKSYDAANPARLADFHVFDCLCLRCQIDRARKALGHD